MSNPYTISPITNGQYHVRLYLDKFDMTSKQIDELRERYDIIHKEDPHFWKICDLYDNVLSYTSETLFPEKDDPNKKKVVIILGNPATHSVANGMFFYSRIDECSHKFWGSLEKAGLINKPYSKIKNKSEKRRYEAEERRKQIEEGKTSSQYLLGLTTFYSFPTPVHGSYKNVSGVRKFFKPFMNHVERMECSRLNCYLSIYPFLKNALIIFHEESSFKTVRQCATNQGISNKIVYWKGSINGSGGEELKRILEQ